MPIRGRGNGPIATARSMLSTFDTEPHETSLHMTQPIDTSAAEAYERNLVPGMFLRWTHVLLERAAPKPGEHVLDVACGTGIAARLAAPLVGPTGKVVGLDIDAGCIEIARRVNLGL